VDPVPSPYHFTENLVAPGIELGLLDLSPGTLTTRPQKRSRPDNHNQYSCFDSTYISVGAIE
jgi:hypothetical protein